MLGIFILVFEILMIILYGIFIRTDSLTTSSLSSLNTGLFFIAAYAFLSIRNRNLDWTVLTNYLFIVMITLQINTLYYLFWQQAFAQSFVSTSSISSSAFISGMEATLAIVATVSYFSSRLTQLSLFVLVMIEVFFFALNWAICRWGISAITGGGAMTIWLFGLVFAACVRRMRFPQLRYSNSAKYFTKSLQIVSLVIVIITWPEINLLMATLDLGVSNLSSSALLQQNAYFQTWLCLFSSIVTTLGLRVNGEKINLNQVINSILNSGILISSSACVIIDPFASILLGMAAPILTFLYDKYSDSLPTNGYPIDTILMAFLGGTFSAIFCGGRNGRTPELSTDPVRQGGLQFASLVVSFLFACIFGLLTGLILRFTSSQDTDMTDMGVWQIESEMMPLYGDDPKLLKLYRMEDRQRLEKENTHFSNRYMTEKIPEKIPQPKKIQIKTVNRRIEQDQSEIRNQR